MYTVNREEESSLKAPDVETVAQRLVSQIEKVIVGKRESIRKSVLSLLCDGHLLIEDIPGVGKTTLAKALAKAMGGEFRRVQFTPDLLPSDVTGSSVFNQKDSQFEFRPGPIFGNVVLVDEINRATPKTQSALLEAMEERQVTTDGETRVLPRPFFVVATQNTIEMTGTYPLPEAQMDRFFARVSLGYPDRTAEASILDRQQISHPMELVDTVAEPDEIVEVQAAVRDVFVHESIRDYVVDLVRATRQSNQLVMGSSPRGSLYLMRAAQARAAMEGSPFVRPDDVKATACLILGHRVITRADARFRGSDAEEIIERVIESVPAPIPVP